MASKKRSRAELEAELRILRKTQIAEGIVQVFLSLIRWGAIVMIARYGYLAIDSLSGKSTLADIGVNFLSNIKVSVALAWSAGVGGIIYGVNQRKLRKDTIERLQKRIQELESNIDSNRTTSNLTPRGDTRPEDKL